MKFRNSSEGGRTLLSFVTMRFPAPTTAILSLGLVAWGCAVYDTELLQSDNGLSGTGNTGAEAGKGGMLGGSSSSNGGTKPTSSAGTQGADGGSGNAGTAAVEGGAPAAEGGSGGDEPGGGGGSAGAGGAGGGGAGGKGGSASSGGSGGSGGGAPVVKCSDNPLNAKTEWKAIAVPESLGNGMESDGLYNPASHAIDGLTGERFSTGQPQVGGEYIQIDFGKVVTFDRVTLQLFNNDVNDYPRGYAVRVTNDGNANAVPVVSGVGTPGGSTVIDLPAPATGQYLRITQTGAVAPETKWWTIGELQVACTD